MKDKIAIKKTIIYIILFILLILMSNVVTSCNGAPSSCDGTTAPIVETSTSDTTPTEFDLAEALPDGSLRYTVIRSMKASDTVISAVKLLYKELEDMSGIAPTVKEDWEPGMGFDVTVKNDSYEILIGDTNRPESAEVKANLKGKYDFAIKIIGNKLVVVGSTNESTAIAVSRLITECRNGHKGTNIMLPKRLSINLTFGGVDSFAYKLANEYKIIMPDSSAPREERAANAVCRGLSSALSENGTANITPGYDKVQPDGGKEILIGDTDRSESRQFKEGLAYYDYVIKVQGNKIVINGGSPTATLAAAEKFIELLHIGGCFDADTKEYTYNYKFSTEHYSPLAYDISGFVPVWKDEYNVPDWMLDFDEKTFAVTFNSARNMSVSHRGDWQNYPENSLAAYASAILAGCDIIEIDVRETKDHIFVMLHDSALTRVTDYNEKGGKNGLPTSKQLSDWTYEQLMQLNLKDKNGKVTEYKIPTLNEAVMIAARRCFVQLDYKVDGSCDVETDVFPIAYQADAIPSFFYRNGYFAIEKWANKSGRESDLEYVKTCKQYLAMSGHSIRAKYWTTENSTTSTVGENPQNWEKMRSEGKTLLWTNLVITYCKYIAENFKPAK